MGGVCSNENGGPASDPKEVARNKRVEEEMRAEYKRQEAVHKMLLLGAGESGKSTLFKQMILLYAKDPFPLDEKMNYAPVIFSNVIDSIKILIEQKDNFADEIPFSREEKRYVETILDLDSADDIDPPIANQILQLWRHPGIQKTYENKSKYYITDSAGYYLDRILDIGKGEDYIPTEEHILRSRTRTTGVIERSFDIKGNTFTMFDVGGQRSERKKWIHCFEGVTCVMFVAAISSYDTVLFEDNKKNRLVEALELFEEICNSRWFERTTIVLFLNKKDIFMEKVTKVPLTVCPALKDYVGPKEYLPAVDFIIEEFYAKNQQNKSITIHVTTATDKNNINVVFESVRKSVVEASLANAGLVLHMG